jgi:hypothetical protein
LKGGCGGAVAGAGDLDSMGRIAGARRTRGCDEAAGSEMLDGGGGAAEPASREILLKLALRDSFAADGSDENKTVTIRQYSRTKSSMRLHARKRKFC